MKMVFDRKKGKGKKGPYLFWEKKIEYEDRLLMRGERFELKDGTFIAPKKGVYELEIDNDEIRAVRLVALLKE